MQSKTHTGLQTFEGCLPPSSLRPSLHPVILLSSSPQDGTPYAVLLANDVSTLAYELLLHSPSTLCSHREASLVTSLFGEPATAHLRFRTGACPLLDHTTLHSEGHLPP